MITKLTKRIIDLSTLPWTLSGYTPTAWTMGRTMELALDVVPEIAPVPAQVPGSVQQALLNAGQLSDWNVGLNSRAGEWVENREWIFSARLPRQYLPRDKAVVLQCLGLDGAGVVLLNGKTIGTFDNSFIPYRFALPKLESQEDPRLEIVFTAPPRFLGTPHRSSEIRDWKPRFNYTWDWMPRNVQIGIWDAVTLEINDGPVLEQLRIETEADPTAKTGSLNVATLAAAGKGDETVRVCLSCEGRTVWEETCSAEALMAGVSATNLPVELWYPNGMGKQALHELTVVLLSSEGAELDRVTRRIGFKHVDWQPCAGAPDGADPWICVVNGTPVFLAGVNWTPIRAHFADVTVEDYRCRIQTYRDLNMNILRVWGGAFLEKECFYDLCDEMGMLVWQEFPLSSSGPDNEPPQDAKAIAEMKAIGTSYVCRRRHHASLLMWCGGNELQTRHDGAPGCGKPLDESHPMLKALGGIVRTEDPGRRYMPTSASGPVFVANENDFGQGRHWDVHGPWRLPGEDFRQAEFYWSQDDALFRSETGAPGASSAELIRTYAGEADLLPVSLNNPYWRRVSWWVDGKLFAREHGREPESLEEYVAWSQEHQGRALALAVRSCRQRFPAIGGVILWMGHDSFPCPANTSILDFHGRPKPAATAVAKALKEL